MCWYNRYWQENTQEIRPQLLPEEEKVWAKPQWKIMVQWMGWFWRKRAWKRNSEREKRHQDDRIVWDHRLRQKTRVCKIQKGDELRKLLGQNLQMGNIFSMTSTYARAEQCTTLLVKLIGPPISDTEITKY